jgi:hypothetical protein
MVCGPAEAFTREQLAELYGIKRGFVWLSTPKLIGAVAADFGAHFAHIDVFSALGRTCEAHQRREKGPRRFGLSHAGLGYLKRTRPR